MFLAGIELAFRKLGQITFYGNSTQRKEILWFNLGKFLPSQLPI
jgi:hypothetical protein